MAGVVPLDDFLCRDTGNGSLLGRRCVEDVDVTDCSERTLSRLEVRLNVDVIGVVGATGIGICDGLASESPKLLSFVLIVNKKKCLLETWGEVTRSSPEAERSPKDAELGGRCDREAIDDVRRLLSFIP